MVNWGNTFNMAKTRLGKIDMKWGNTLNLAQTAIVLRIVFGLVEHIIARSNNSDEVLSNKGILIEILSRLPPKSVVRLQLVSKRWQSLIREHYFVEKYLNNSRGEVTRYFKNDSVYRPLRIRNENFGNQYARFIDGCDGILFMELYIWRRQVYFLWNPSLQRMLEIPIPTNQSDAFSFSYVPTTQNYRLVSLYRNTDNGSFGCEVFTPGESRKWRELSFPDIGNFDGNGIHTEKKRGSIVSCGTTLHFILVLEVGYSNYIEEIVSLDLASECFTTKPLPSVFFKNSWIGVSAIGWGRKLVFADMVGESTLKVMVLQDHKWRRETKLVSFPMNTKVSYPLFEVKDDIWFSWGSRPDGTLGFKITTGNSVKAESEDMIDAKEYPLKHSMVTFRGMQPHGHFIYRATRWANLQFAVILALTVELLLFITRPQPSSVPSLSCSSIW